MEFQEMLNKIKGIPLLQLQEQQDKFFGVVMKTDQLQVLEPLLASFFGLPLKPPHSQVTPEVARITRPYGGIMENQTLYFRRQYQERSILAMIWPWNDGSNFTLKIFQDAMIAASE